MAARLIGQVVVRDQERFALLCGRTSAIIAGCGGEALDGVQAVAVVEGTGAWERLQPWSASRECVRRAFWDSPDNCAVKDLRHASATGHVALCISLLKN